MSELSPAQTHAMRNVAANSHGSLAQRWNDLHAQAFQLAKLAKLAPEPDETELMDVPAMLGEANEWQRELAWQAIEDIDAMMQPGMVALRTILAREQDPHVPALALWREFHAARGSVISLANAGHSE